MLSMEENTKNAIESQMDMFEKFDAGTALSTEKLLGNMQSQVDGVREWERNLVTLAESGIDGGLLKHLSEMGPEGAAYVQTFVDMTDEELAQANDLWKQSVDIKSMTNGWGEELLETGTQCIADSMDGVTEAMDASGAETVQGWIDGVIRAQKDAEKVGEDLGVNLIDKINSGLGVASPSKKTKESGGYTVEGLVDGVKENESDAIDAGEGLGLSVIEALESCNMYDNAFEVGVNFADGMKEGILSKTQEVANEAAAMVRSAIDAANREQDAHSPAKEVIKVGHNFGEGAEVGISDKIPDVSKAAATMMNKIITTISGQEEAVKRNLAAVLDVSSINVNTQALKSAPRSEDLYMLRDMIIDGMKKVKLVSYMDGRKITREFSRLGVVFNA